MSTRIKDERWTIRDKLAQYRGVAKLQGKQIWYFNKQIFQVNLL